jgi:hypothetical protein
MPTVGDLDRVRQHLRRRLSITAAAVSRDDFDLRMVCEPGLDGRDLAVGKRR